LNSHGIVLLHDRKIHRQALGGATRDAKHPETRSSSNVCACGSLEAHPFVEATVGRNMAAMACQPVNHALQNPGKTMGNHGK